MARGGRKKFVCVGDEASGKTSLLKAFCGGDFSEEYVPTVSESYVVEKPTPLYEETGPEGETRTTFTTIELCDTTGSEELDRLRPLSYDGADLWIVCFSVDSRQSLINVIEKWVPEVKYFAPSIPLILVGCKVDLRNDPDALDRLDRLGEVAVAIEEAQDVAREIGAFKYVETSAKLGFQVSNLFDDNVDDSGEYDEEDEELAEDGEEEQEEEGMEDIVEEEEDEEVPVEEVSLDLLASSKISDPDEDEKYVTANSSSQSLLPSHTDSSTSSTSSFTATLPVENTLSAASSYPTPTSSPPHPPHLPKPEYPAFSPHAHQPTQQQHHRLSRMLIATATQRISADDHPALPTHAPARPGLRDVVTVTAKGVVVGEGIPGRRRRRRKGHSRRDSTASSISTLSTGSSGSSIRSIESGKSGSLLRSGLPSGGVEDGLPPLPPPLAVETEMDLSVVAVEEVVEEPAVDAATPPPVVGKDDVSSGPVVITESESLPAIVTTGADPSAASSESTLLPPTSSFTDDFLVSTTTTSAGAQDASSASSTTADEMLMPEVAVAREAMVAVQPSAAPLKRDSPTKMYPSEGEVKHSVSRVEVVEDRRGSGGKGGRGGDDAGCKCTIL
ncbi:GTP-binding protein Rho1 [Dinochytrium kinnereticum]|nr:GTP-binding protein Rho1 [Dinochytrium kinnereticum]